MDQEQTSRLKKVWREGGAARLKQFLTWIARNDTSTARWLLNDENLDFPVLFIWRATYIPLAYIRL
jgi:hypothetical protein